MPIGGRAKGITHKKGTREIFKERQEKGQGMITSTF
jgi:hypothetical protein